MQRAADLDRAMRELTVRTGATLAEHRRHWYGLDPIHIRRRWRREAWPYLLCPDVVPASVNLGARVRLRGCAHELRWVFGRERRTAQPSARLPDGTAVSVY
jgi:hypothetical protein